MASLVRLLSAALLIAFGVLALSGAPAGASALSAPSHAALREALKQRCPDFGRQSGSSAAANAKPPEPVAGSMRDNSSALVLAAAANHGSRKARAAVLKRIRHLAVPAKLCKDESFNTASSEPTGTGGVSAQKELWASSLFVVAKHTPSVWKSLSKFERRRIDLIMLGALVSNAFATGDGNPYVKGDRERTIDGQGNVGRDWNPNYREGMLGNVLMGIAYFGRAGAQQRLAGFNRPAYLAALQERGLTNLATTFSWGQTHPAAGVPTDAEVGAAIANWTYHGVGLTNPMGLYASLTTFNFDKPVACGVNGGAGVKTKSGKIGGRLADPSQCGQLALGQAGMLHEFASRDGGGVRSSATYAYMGWQANLATQVGLIASHLWKRGAAGSVTTAQLMALKRVGTTDLFSKLRLGYVNYSLGKVQPAPGKDDRDVVMRLSLSGDPTDLGYRNTWSLWNQVVLRSPVIRPDR